MPARIEGELGVNTGSESQSGGITLEGDNITVNAPATGSPGAVVTQSPKNFLPILLVIALVAAIWYYLKKKGQAS